MNLQEISIETIKEIQQLFFVATKYYNLAKPYLEKINKNKTLGEINNNWFDSRNDKIDSEVISISHLSSAAIRLWSIDEIIRKNSLDPNDSSLRINIYDSVKKQKQNGHYTPKKMKQIIHLILRNTSSHMEDRITYPMLFKEIGELKVGDLLSFFHNAYIEIQRDINR